jgi:NAD(P)-dependent dehydrogenase (short-subunit alcohol dehydrogenase family)
MGDVGLLDGRVALVTGASRGLGRAIARVLAREGADVAFNYTRADAEAAALVEEIRAAGRRALPFKVSVIDRAGVQEMVRRIEGEWSPVDVLVNNAGVGQVVPLALMEEEDWDRMMGVNVKGAFLVSQAVLRGFTEALAKEVGHYGVTVNALAPGILEEGVSANLPAPKLQEYLRNCALGRVGTFAEVAEVVAFVASDRNGYMNGATIVLDGAV